MIKQQQKQQDADKMKHTTSLELIKTKTILTKDITKEIVIKASDFSTYFSIFLANSKGKDKFLSLFQYIFEFICTCCKHSNIKQNVIAYQKKTLVDMLIYYNLKQNISSARKVFRLFRFFDEIKGLSKILKSNKPFLFKFLSTITYFCSIMYYICDNTLWLIGVMVKSGAIKKVISKSWKYRKNFFSFYRIIFYLVILIYSIRLQRQQNEGKQENIKNSINNQFDDSLSKLSKQYVVSRRKTRFLYLELALSLMRLLMLISSLKLKGHQRLDSIFVAWCGVGSAILGFLKALYQKRIVLNLQKKQEGVQEHIMSMAKLSQKILHFKW